MRILTYHRVAPPRDGPFERLTVPPERFGKQIRSMAALGCRFIGMDEVRSGLDGKRPEAGRAVALTFDDGYRDLYEYALPFLREAGIPAMVYLVAHRDRDEWVDWNGKGHLDLLGWREAGEMAEAGVVFGSHTLTHPRLTRISDARLASEVGDSKKIIEDRLGREVRHFCYPYGDFDARVQEAVRAVGYVTACTTRKGVVYPGTDPFLLPRLTVGKRMGLFRFWRRLLLTR